MTTTTEMKQAVRVHELKYWPDFFKKTVNGKKTFELRRNDHNYMLGDVSAPASTPVIIGCAFFGRWVFSESDNRGSAPDHGQSA
jgi:hypothetical protein